MNTSRLKKHLKEEQRQRLRLALLITVSLMVAFAAVISWISAGCSSGDSDTGTVDETTASGTETGRRVPTFASIEQTVSRIRGLPLKGDIPISYATREQLQADVEKELMEQYPAEKAESEEKVLKTMGLIGKDVDLMQEVEQLLGGGVVGYYDEKTKQLYVVSEDTEITPMNEITLAHEIAHALQDQHFDLSRLVVAGDSGNSDRDLAQISLAEGDATQVEEEYISRVMGPVDLAGAVLDSLGVMGDMGPAPPYLQDTLEFPYLSGANFVSYLLEGEGWEAVNEAYGRLPESTEQIIHPDRYVIGDVPVDVVIPDLTPVIGPGWETGDEDVVGEFTVIEMLDTQLVRARSLAAGEGWGGGAYRLYQQGDGIVLVMVLTWDTLPDAGEFSSAMGESLEKRYAQKFGSEAPVRFLESPDGVWALGQHGKSVAVVAAPDKALAAAVAQIALGI